MQGPEGFFSEYTDFQAAIAKKATTPFDVQSSSTVYSFNKKLCEEIKPLFKDLAKI